MQIIEQARVDIQKKKLNHLPSSFAEVSQHAEPRMFRAHRDMSLFFNSVLYVSYKLPLSETSYMLLGSCNQAVL